MLEDAPPTSAFLTFEAATGNGDVARCSVVTTVDYDGATGLEEEPCR